MEVEKTSEAIIKVGDGEKNPHAIKALTISFFALVLSLAGFGGAEELKIMSASNIIESNYQTMTEFRSLRRSLLLRFKDCHRMVSHRQEKPAHV